MTARSRRRSRRARKSPSWSSRPATRRRRSCRWWPVTMSGEAGFFGAHLARAQVAVRDGVSATGTVPGRFISLEGGEGVGKSTQVRALAEALASARIDVVVTREPGGSEGAETIRDCCSTDDDESGMPRPKPCFLPPPGPTMSRKTIRAGAGSGALGAVPTASSTARSPIRGARAALESRPCARSTPSPSASTFPIAPWS